MDREWSSQPLASDQTGWDWLSLHFNSGEKLMLYRMRQTDGNNYASANWILPDGKGRQIASADITMTPKALTEIGERKIPTTWDIAIAAAGAEDLLRAAQSEELDGNELCLLGRADQFCRQPHWRWISGNDRLLKDHG